jgi:hypothetical protein
MQMILVLEQMLICLPSYVLFLFHHARLIHKEQFFKEHNLKIIPRQSEVKDHWLGVGPQTLSLSKSLLLELFKVKVLNKIGPLSV